MASDDDTSLSDRISALREKVQRREQKVRADRQAKERRIEKDEPGNVREKAASKVRKAKAEGEMSAEEARNLAKDAKELIGTELGVSANEAEGVIERGADLLDSAGDQLDSLDGDGDGDTDVLTTLDVSGGGRGGNTGSQSRQQSGATDKTLDEQIGTETLLEPSGRGTDLSDTDIDFSQDT